MSNPSIPLQAPEDYRTSGERQQIYPSQESFRWFIRQHRTELVEAGAILRPNGRWLVQPDSFDRAVMQIGQRRARRG